MSGRAIRFQGVRYGYFRGLPVFEGLDLEIGPGLTLVLGPNGNGKSTLLKLAAGVEKPDAGAVLVNGFDLWSHEVEARRDLAYVPEQPNITPFASVRAVLGPVCRLRGEPPSAVTGALSEVGEPALGSRSIRELSNGQRRRVLLAAARIGSPRTLLLDEPLAALDRDSRARICDWIGAVCRGGGLALLVTHEIEPFVDLATAALRVGRAGGRLHAPLPTAPKARRSVLETLAHGAMD